MSAVITDDLSFHIYDLSYQLPVLFHNEVQFRNEVRIVPIAMEHIMFQTSRPVNIPECLSREILSLSVVSRCLRTNDDILSFNLLFPPCMIQYFQIYTDVVFRKTKVNYRSLRYILVNDGLLVKFYYLFFLYTRIFY